MRPCSCAGMTPLHLVSSQYVSFSLLSVLVTVGADCLQLCITILPASRSTSPAASSSSLLGTAPASKSGRLHLSSEGSVNGRSYEVADVARSSLLEEKQPGPEFAEAV
jgi:hypothetical protein